MIASPKKLRSGDWGALVQSTRVRKGDRITIRTKAGKTWSATVSRVLWTGQGVAICTTESAGGSRSRRRHGPGAGAAAPVPGYSSYCTDTEDCGCYDCAS